MFLSNCFDWIVLIELFRLNCLDQIVLSNCFDCIVLIEALFDQIVLIELFGLYCFDRIILIESLIDRILSIQSFKSNCLKLNNNVVIFYARAIGDLTIFKTYCPNHVHRPLGSYSSTKLFFEQSRMKIFSNKTDLRHFRTNLTLGIFEQSRMKIFSNKTDLRHFRTNLTSDIFEQNWLKAFSNKSDIFEQTKKIPVSAWADFTLGNRSHFSSFTRF
jgi:hypothetical protein